MKRCILNISSSDNHRIFINTSSSQPSPAPPEPSTQDRQTHPRPDLTASEHAVVPDDNERRHRQQPLLVLGHLRAASHKDMISGRGSSTDAYHFRVLVFSGVKRRDARKLEHVAAQADTVTQGTK
jgi:hypothetical protein